jgi:ring-1,2-phenylacetyl-CoA epoxidase subunit PaaC
MAQDQMGHALVMYNMLHDLGEPDADTLVYTRRADQFRCCALVSLDVFRDNGTNADALSNNPTRDRLVATGDWSLSFVRQFLFAEANALRMHALEQSDYEPLAHLARKVRGELKYHTMHGRTLIAKFGRAGGEGRERVQRALTVLYPYALGIFEPTPSGKILAQHGVCPAEEAICEQWRSEVSAIANAAGFSYPRDAKAVLGGRKGDHPDDLSAALEDLQKVAKLSPGAKW